VISTALSWTSHRAASGGGKWALVVLTPLANALFGSVGLTSWRLLTRRGGAIPLHADELVVDDPSLFHRPLVVAREHVVDAMVPPAGALEYGQFVREVAAVFLDLVASRATAHITFDQSVALPPSRWGNSLLLTRTPLRAPVGGRATHGLLVRIDDPDSMHALF